MDDRQREIRRLKAETAGLRREHELLEHKRRMDALRLERLRATLVRKPKPDEPEPKRV